MGKIKEKLMRINAKHILIVVAFLAAFALCSSHLTYIGYSQQVLHAEEDKASDYSFYMLASVAAAAYSTALADDTIGPEQALNTYFGSVNSATAGGLLAYPDKNSHGIVGMFTHIVTASATDTSYSSIGKDALPASFLDSGASPFMGFCTLGAVLRDLGIDKTSAGVQGDVMTVLGFGRGVIGKWVYFTWVIASTVTIIFNWVISLLKLFNPFKAFGAIVTTGGSLLSSNSYTSRLRSIGSGTGYSFLGISIDVWAGIKTFVAQWYTPLYITGLVFLILGFGFLFYKILMPGALKRGENRFTLLKNWFIRGLFTIGGLALLGGTYTAALDWLDDMTSGGNTAATKVVASTFCDFENWVMAGMPSSSGVASINIPYSTNGRGAIKAMPNTDAQDLCFKINYMSFNNNTRANNIIGSPPGAAAGGLLSGIIDDVQTNVQAGNTHVQDNQFTWVASLLARYVAETQCTSTAYESAWKMRYWHYTDRSKTEALQKFIELSDAVPDITTANDLAAFRYSASNISLDGVAIANPFGASGYVGGTGYSYSAPSVSNVPCPIDINTYTSLHDINGVYTLGSSGQFLSAMSIYNYLNARFDNTKITMYSNSLVGTLMARENHNAVNLVGNSHNGIVIFLTCITLLTTYVILAFAYAWGMIIVNIKRGFRLIVAVPGAMLGSLQAIAKIISYTVLMIVEIMIHIMLYMLSTELLYTFAKTITSLIYNNTAMFGAIDTTLFSGILVIVSLWWFTFQAIKLKKPIIKSVEQMTDNVVQKFITGTSAAERRQIAAQQAGSAAGAATGAAAGTAAANSKSSGSKSVGSTQDSSGEATKNPAKHAKAKREAKKAKGEAETNLMLSQMGLSGGTSSALEEEKTLDGLQKAKVENKKNEVKQKAEAAKKTVVGAGEVVAGVYTENPALVARGAKNVAQGAADSSAAEINKANNDAAAIHNAAAANGSVGANSGEAKAQDIQKNNIGVKKMNLANEAIGAGAAYLGGQAGAGSAGAGQAANLGSIAGGASSGASSSVASSAASEAIGTNGGELASSAIQSNGTKALVSGKEGTVGNTSMTSNATAQNTVKLSTENQYENVGNGTSSKPLSNTPSGSKPVGNNTGTESVRNTTRLNAENQYEVNNNGTSPKSLSNAPSGTKNVGGTTSTETTQNTVTVDSQTNYEQGGNTISDNRNFGSNNNSIPSQNTDSTVNGGRNTVHADTEVEYVPGSEKIIGGHTVPHSGSKQVGSDTSETVRNRHVVNTENVTEYRSNDIEVGKPSSGPVGGHGGGSNTSENIQNKHTVVTDNITEHVSNDVEIGRPSSGPVGGGHGGSNTSETVKNKHTVNTENVTENN